MDNNKDSWKQQAIALAETNTMSWRKIAETLGKPKSSISDMLRAYYLAKAEERVGEMYDEPSSIEQEPVIYETVFKIVTDTSKEEGTHLFIPDCQVKPDISLDYLRWLGEYIVRKQPDVIVNIGDFADMESLSSYDKGKRSAEGKRVIEDINSAIEGMEALLEPLYNLQQCQLEEFGEVLYKPRLVMCLGNHEGRINRYVDDTPELHGFLSIDDLKYKEFGWEVYDFLTPVKIADISYCHYFPNTMNGKPMGGTAATMLKNLGGSFTQGHKQTLDVATRYLQIDGTQQWGLICGAYYQHEEVYKGNQGNHHFRGVVVKHRVKNGSYDPLFVSMEWLKEQYGKD